LGLETLTGIAAFLFLFLTFLVIESLEF